MTTSNYPAPPYGYELHITKSSLGRRCLCSHTEIARLLASRELKPVGGSGYRDYHYSAEDLDRIRAANVEKVSAKFKLLNLDEKQRLAATAAEFAAVHAGLSFRAKPNAEDVAVGHMAAASGARSGRARMASGPRIRLRATDGGIFN